MTEPVEFAVRAFLIGAGATLVMDLWAVLLRQFGVPSLNLAFLGRWLGHLPRGRWRHPGIARATPVRGESWIGWCARTPSLLPPLFMGIVTVVAPLLTLQPGMGAGIASWKTTNPVFNCVKSLVTHTVFGLGMYLAALATAWVRPFGS